MPQVTKLFEITFEEPEKDWLNDNNLEVILGAAFSDKEEEAHKFTIRDLTNRTSYEENFAKAVATVVPEEQYDESEINKTPTDIQKRNDLLRSKADGDKVSSPHSAPGTGKPCTDPKQFKEKLRTGGSISFCPTCGYQYLDTDLIKE